jgi:hypothetical protein
VFRANTGCVSCGLQVYPPTQSPPASHPTSDITRRRAHQPLRELMTEWTGEVQAARRRRSSSLRRAAASSWQGQLWPVPMATYPRAAWSDLSAPLEREWLRHGFGVRPDRVGSRGPPFVIERSEPLDRRAYVSSVRQGESVMLKWLLDILSRIDGSRTGHHLDPAGEWPANPALLPGLRDWAGLPSTRLR